MFCTKNSPDENRKQCTDESRYITNDNSSLDEKISDFIKYLDGREKFSLKKEAKLADKWLTWACSNSHIGIVACVIPEGILPDNWWGKLLDCKVFTNGGPDDEIFDNNPDIRKKVARGNCFLEVRSPNWSMKSSCVVRGISKFTGGMGDDDDRALGDDFTWKSYFAKPLESVKTIISTNKVNGESAHVSGTIIDGVRYWVAGSKNVHMLFRDEDDLDKYDTSQQRFRLAREISQTWLEYVNNHFDDSVRLHNFVVSQGLTANFEFLNPAHSHVEDLSHLGRPQLVFITWTLLNLESLFINSKEELTILAPDVAAGIAKSFNLNTVDCMSIQPEFLDEHLYKIRLQYSKEGEVLYFLDDTYRVIGLLKKKSIWYIVVRAIREKVKGMMGRFLKQNKKFSLTTEMAKISKRLNEIQQWLKLDSETIERYKDLTSEFVKWLLTLAEKEVPLDKDISENFPFYWQRFLSETSLSDKFIINQSAI